MPILDSNLRDQLATVIGKESQEGGARAVAEAGATAAIESLAVHLKAPYAHLDLDARALRNRLRARARQLGDTRYADGRHEIARILEQAAYAQWHRMLFARFLAENGLLIHPELGGAVTIDECSKLASDEGAVDAWDLAGRYASRMLPRIFSPSDPVLKIKMAAEHQHRLEKLLASLPSELFLASDSLGWCYQFWQARKKKDISASEIKVGSDELPPVTQLFTDAYMVNYLLQNTLVSWWIASGHQPPADTRYLLRANGSVAATADFDDWPKQAAQLRILDPCCGSGHFLVAAFEMLVRFRIQEEGLAPCEACHAVLRENLFGLELDHRCVQIAAFTLALAAWTYPGAGGYRVLPSMNIACSGLATKSKREQWERLAGTDTRVREGLGRLWDLFAEAPTLGSLVDPTRDPPDPLYVAGPEECLPLLGKALEVGARDQSAEVIEGEIAARGLVEAGRILGGKFHLVATNVPYLARGKQGPVLRSFIDDYHHDARGELATVMMDRALRYCYPGGAVAVVSQQSWTFLGTYRKFRERLLRDVSFSSIVKLGPRAFETVSGEVVNVAMVIFTCSTPSSEGEFLGLDLTQHSTARMKEEALRGAEPRTFSQTAQAKNPDARIILDSVSTEPKLGKYCTALAGINTGDYARWGRVFCEVFPITSDWELQQTTTGETAFVGGLTQIVRWCEGGGAYARYVASLNGRLGGSWKRGVEAWGKPGVAISQMSSLPAALYAGTAFDSNVAAVVPKDPALVPAIYAYCASTDYCEAVRQIDQKMNVTNATLAKVPFDVGRWKKEGAQLFPNGIPPIATSDPAQWAFDGALRTSDSPLHVAVAGLLGFRWPQQSVDPCPSPDEDGIVCIPPLWGEPPAADRVSEILADAWGDDWHPQVLTDLLSDAGHSGTLEEWIRDHFFAQHCLLYRQRPFIWHVWDGHKAGFSALLNYHKLDHATLKSLTYSYLGEWIRVQSAESKAGKSGAAQKAESAKALQLELAAILKGEAPYDIFVRWKALEQQPVGWQPDLNDGVRLNIRPFMIANDVGVRGAGLLRRKPTIKWGVDRGKNPHSAPWGETRDNAMHLSLEEKRKAGGGP